MALQEHSKAKLYDLKGKNDIECEVNFSKDPDLADVVKITLDGNEALIPIKDLYAFTFAIANEEQQADMMPVTQTTVKKLVKFHKVKVTKELKPGEFVAVRCEVNVPVEIYNGMRKPLNSWVEKKKANSVFIPGIIKQVRDNN